MARYACWCLTSALGSALPVQSHDSLSVSLRLPLYSFVVNLCRLLPLQRKQRRAVGRAAQRARLGLVPVLVVVAGTGPETHRCLLDEASVLVRWTRGIVDVSDLEHSETRLGVRW